MTTPELRLNPGPPYRKKVPILSFRLKNKKSMDTFFVQYFFKSIGTQKNYRYFLRTPVFAGKNSMNSKKFNRTLCRLLTSPFQNPKSILKRGRGSNMSQ